MTPLARVPLFSARRSIAAGIFLVTFMVIAVTTGGYGVTWDEPPYFHASDLHVQWILDFGKNLARGNAGQSLQDDAVKTAWRWDPYHVPHPPFSRIISGLIKTLVYPGIDKFAAYRLGPALFFALLVTSVYFWTSDLFGVPTGVFAALTVAVTPNLFAFAHIAVTDMPLASMWFLTAYCFWRGLESWKWSAVLGLVWGLALATKFPAVLIPVPLILWAHLFYRTAYGNNVFALLFVSPLVMIASQPYLWHQPGLRILEFLYEGLSRGYRPETSFTVFFLGQLYHTNQLPWYYPFFIVGVTTPEIILALALLAVAGMGFFRERFPAVMLFFVNAVFTLLLGLMPGAVLHDGARQLLSAFPFLAALAGGGFFLIIRLLLGLAERLKALSTVKDVQSKIPAVVIVLFLFHATLDVYLCHPYQLSYYNRLVGGIRGAYARGLEMTYFGEAITPSLLRSLNENLPAQATLNASFASFLFEYYQREGRLRPDITITGKQSFDYYLLLNRQSVLSAPERALLRSAEPAMTIGPAGVPLVAVFRRAR